MGRENAGAVGLLEREEPTHARGLERGSVAEAVASLSLEGWTLLRDRVTPSGATIGHIVVGPGSVIVVDVKAWKGSLAAHGDHLFNDRWSQQKVLHALAERRNAVRSVLADTIASDDPVDMALVISSQPQLFPKRVGDVTVLGIGHLLGGIRSSRTSYSPEQVKAIIVALVSAFPPITEAPPSVRGLQQVDGVDVGSLFDRANRFYFINQWTRGRRVYIRDEDGEQYGYKAFDDGSIQLDHGDLLAEAVLAASNSCGVDLAMLRVPRLPIDVAGGPLPSVFANLHTTAIVGSLWQSGDRRWLHGTLASPSQGPFNLGYVDLSSGELHPASTGPLCRDRGPAERYLELLRDRHPFNRLAVPGRCSPGLVAA